MSARPAPEAWTRFWQTITLFIAGLTAAVAVALSGGSASGRVQTFASPSQGVGLVFDIEGMTGVDTPGGWSQLMREVFLDVDATVLRGLETELRSVGTKVPKETGYLRQSVQVFISPDGTRVIARWPVQYAAYLWQDYAPGYVSVSGLARHGEVTYPNWRVWAEQLILPKLAEGFASAFRSRGFEARVVAG